MRSLLAGVAFVALLASAQTARACADGGPETGRWSLDHGEFSDQVGLPFLSPGNDTRINLQFLMRDAHPWAVKAPAPGIGPASISGLDTPALFTMSELAAAFQPATADRLTVFSDDEGVRCVSFEGGKQAFLDALQAESSLVLTERTQLADARTRLAVACLTKDAAPAPAATDPLAGVSQPSPAAKDFAAYLTGAKAFYDGDFDAALARFGALAQSNNPWLKETARYMTARALLNKAEIGAFAALDGAPEPKVTDKAALDASEAAFKAYLQAYPSGRYAASARGLLRRVYWLGGDKAKLSAEYAWQASHIGEPQANLGATDLAQEIDAKFLGVKPETHDPLQLAVLDLQRLRSNGKTKPKFPAADLDAQAADFGGRDALYGYVKAARAYYADGDPEATLKLLGPPAPGAPYLGFSREVLRGQALMAEGRYPDAIDHWRGLLASAREPWQHEAVELGLAMSWEQSGAVNKAFLPETRIESPRIRATLLRWDAGPILLRMALVDPQATGEEKALARFTLLYKEATRGLYSGFQRDYAPSDFEADGRIAANLSGVNSAALLWAGAKEPYACPELKAVVTELAANPKSSHGLLCLGEFTRATDLDSVEAGRPSADELGGGKPIFPGEVFARGDVYKKLIADTATPDRDRAYALFRAVNCYRPAGMNTCGGGDVEQSQRKAWYDELKAKYGSTAWARSLKYYW